MESDNELINSSDYTDSSKPGDNCDSITSHDNDDESKPTYAEAVKTSKEPEIQIGCRESYGGSSCCAVRYAVTAAQPQPARPGHQPRHQPGGCAGAQHPLGQEADLCCAVL